MALHVWDTNVYVPGVRAPDPSSAFWTDHDAAAADLRLSAVVLTELLAGARDAREIGTIERLLLAPFRAAGRLLVPGVATWQIAARAERALRVGGAYAGSLAQASFFRDLLIAVSCRQVGATLVTANARDFEIIRTVLAFRFTTAFPTS